MSTAVFVRTATVDDAEQVVAVMNGVIAEGTFTLFDTPFSLQDERDFIASRGPRSALYVAAGSDGDILGVQSLDRFSTLAASMRHVATMGTWLRRDARGRGIGRELAAQSLAFARRSGYTKIVIQVLAGNENALRFYRDLGFTDIGVARQHVRLAGTLHDEIYLEMQL